MRLSRYGGDSLAVRAIHVFLFASAVYAASIPSLRSNATVSKDNLTRRADSPTKEQDPFDWGYSSNDDGPSKTSNDKPIDYEIYVEYGGLINSFLRASEEKITHVLVGIGKLRAGETIASRFTEESEFTNNGWPAGDKTPEFLGGFGYNVADRDSTSELGNI
jgi:hypothetical protein